MIEGEETEGPPPPSGELAEPVVLPTVDAPRATVIVLAWRMTEPLLDCLRALVGSQPSTAYEVILVLNGATADVRRTVGVVRGARVVDSPVNLGFGVGMNLGARHARGDYLVLLNDDAEVRPGWLDGLVASADASPRVAMVSSTLLFPDGRVQQAGCRLLPDGDVVELGHGLPELSPELSHLRDVDFAGGAAVLVRRSTFEEVGGFDPVFDPAYYEDVDLSLRVRARGWRVVHEPSAVAVHRTSSSTKDDLYFRAFAVQRAGRTFRSRWQSLLEGAPSRDDSVDVLVPVPQECPTAVSPGIRVPGDAVLRALRLQEEYAHWLTSRLDREISAVDALEHRLAAMAGERDAAEARFSGATVQLDAERERGAGPERSAASAGRPRPLVRRLLRR